MPNTCQQIKQEYQDLKTLKKEFDLEYTKALKTGNLNKARILKTRLEQKRDALTEKIWPFEAMPQKELKQQYDSQLEIMKRVGILEKLSNGKIGIKAIDNQEYAYPTYSEITKRMRKAKN